MRKAFSTAELPPVLRRTSTARRRMSASRTAVKNESTAARYSGVS